MRTQILRSHTSSQLLVGIRTFINCNDALLRCYFDLNSLWENISGIPNKWSILFTVHFYPFTQLLPCMILLAVFNLTLSIIYNFVFLIGRFIKDNQCRRIVVLGILCNNNSGDQLLIVRSLGLEPQSWFFSHIAKWLVLGLLVVHDITGFSLEIFQIVDWKGFTPLVCIIFRSNVTNMFYSRRFIVYIIILEAW